MLCETAATYVGVREEGGYNKGKMVEEFQRAVDGKAEGESWCMAFVQYCLKKVDASGGAASWIFKTEHCLTCWNKTPKEARLTKPEVGSIVIWNHYQNGKPTTAGHTGIVEKIVDANTMITIEGNTGAGDGINREGDGVYRRKRLIGNSGSFVVLGFLKPWKNVETMAQPVEPTVDEKKAQVEIIPAPSNPQVLGFWNSLMTFLKALFGSRSA